MLLRLVLLGCLAVLVVSCKTTVTSPIDAAGNCFFEPWRPNC